MRPLPSAVSSAAEPRFSDPCGARSSHLRHTCALGTGASTLLGLVGTGCPGLGPGPGRGAGGARPGPGPSQACVAPVSVSVSAESALSAVTVAAGPDLLGVCRAEPSPPPADGAPPAPWKRQAPQSRAPFPEQRFRAASPPSSCRGTPPGRLAWRLLGPGLWTDPAQADGSLAEPLCCHCAWSCPPTHGLGPPSLGCGRSLRPSVRHPHPRARGVRRGTVAPPLSDAGSLVLALSPGGGSVSLSDPCDSAQLPAEVGSLSCGRPWETLRLHEWSRGLGSPGLQCGPAARPEQRQQDRQGVPSPP